MGLEDEDTPGRRCSTCKLPCKGHNGLTGSNCQAKPAESEDIAQQASGDMTNMFLRQLLDQMRHQNVGISSLQAKRDEIPSNQDHKTVEEPKIGPGMCKKWPGVSTKAVESAGLGEFVNLADFLKPIHDTETQFEAQMIPNGLEFREKKQRKGIDNFLSWLQAWYLYELVVVSKRPEVYENMARYRQLIQDCDKKYKWSAVFLYDMHLRQKRSLACSFQFNDVDNDPFTTILDATAVKQHSAKCFRCKSAEHMVQNCPFPAAQTTMETGSKAQKRITHQQDRWYYNGAEGCSNFPTGQCRFQETCRRANVCRKCKGPEPESKCIRCNPQVASGSDQSP